MWVAQARSDVSVGGTDSHSLSSLPMMPFRHTVSGVHGASSVVFDHVALAPPPPTQTAHLRSELGVPGATWPYPNPHVLHALHADADVLPANEKRPATHCAHAALPDSAYRPATH